MNMNNATSASLRYCLIAGILLIFIGLIFSEYEIGNSIMWIGLLVLIASPFLGVIVTYVHLIKEKDIPWVKIATILIVVITIGLIMSIFW